ncbi:MAG: repressor LexA [Parcubacteria group bacterium]|nr:repressor LexA [Parcubacteria group bacterium]
MSKTSLTRKQKVILDYIADYIEKKNMAPLTTEIQNELKFKSTRSVFQYLDALKAKGYIKKDNTPRSIKLVEDFKEIDGQTELIPLLGTASCGTPAFFADDNIEEYLPVDVNLLNNYNKHSYFLLKTSGTSMDKADINDKSIVLVEKLDAYENGDKVVAILDGLATIKTLHKGNEAFVLTPESSDTKHKPIIVKNEFHIAGKVVCEIPDITDVGSVKYVPLKNMN